MTSFIDDFSGGAEDVRLGDIFSGTLNFMPKALSI
jgi:hypothetical protein